MDTRILYGTESNNIPGLAVVIDVFRAFSTACYIADKSPAKLIITDSLEHARQLKERFPDALLAGERGGVRPQDFDFGNSPSEILKADLTGKTVIHTTSAGTKGLIRAFRTADDVITGAFVNAGAVEAYVRNVRPQLLSLLITNPSKGSEDDAFARYLISRLNDEPVDFNGIARDLRHSQHASHFFNPSITSHPESDFHYCMKLNAFDFVLKARSAEGFVELVKVRP